MKKVIIVLLAVVTIIGALALTGCKAEKPYKSTGFEVLESTYELESNGNFYSGYIRYKYPSQTGYNIAVFDNSAEFAIFENAKFLPKELALSHTKAPAPIRRSR